VALGKYVYLWYAALSQRYGIKVSTNDPEKLRQKLYADRRNAADPALETMSLRISPRPDEVWITKETPDGSPQTGE
jgi:hypothetical protein